MTDFSYILYFQYIQYTSTSMSMYCTVYWDIYTITVIFIYSRKYCSYILYFLYIQYTSTSMSMYCTVYWDIYTITDIFIYSRKYDRLQLHPVLYIYEYEYELYTGIYTMTKNFIKYICSMKDCSCMLYLQKVRVFTVYWNLH